MSDVNPDLDVLVLCAASMNAQQVVQRMFGDGGLLTDVLVWFTETRTSPKLRNRIEALRAAVGADDDR